MKRLIIVFAALVLIGAVAMAWFTWTWTSQGPNATNTVVLIQPGTGLSRIALQLEEAGVIGNRLLFEAELRWRGQAGQLKAGEYDIPAFASMAHIAEILVAGRSIQHRLTVAEGLTSGMIWKLVQANPVLVGDPGPVPIEGTLLPETYLFARGQTRQGLLKEMAAAQARFIADNWPNRRQDLPYTTPEQAVILASIVEKETGFADERRMVASVFVNRLRLRMRLQSDPTIIYGLTKGYPLGRGIRQSELSGVTAYNTYQIDGLPPGPIANPGKDALLAVMNPPDSDALYFVADAGGSGRSRFSATLGEHSRHVSDLRASERGLRPVPQGVPAGDINSQTPRLPGGRAR